MFMPIHNDPMPYSWGDLDSIPRWRGVPPTGGPQAELWFGTHPMSPSWLEPQAGSTVSLAQWLGENNRTDSLPYLVKVLAASRPLSIQVHPARDQAVEGFDRENAEGIPVDSSTRNYKDPFPKPELLISWSDRFDALVGFVSSDRASEVLSAIRRVIGEDNELDEGLFDVNLVDLVTWLFASEHQISKLSRALSRAHQVGNRSGDENLDRLWDFVIPPNPEDSGIIAASFMNVVTLAHGEALFIPAQVPHAYLRGFGLEVMAPSDNVLRAGLTPKHKDSAELLTIVQREPYLSPRLFPETFGSISRWAPEGAPFEVALVDGLSVSEQVAVTSPTIAVVEKGEFIVRGEDPATLSAGSAYVAVPPLDHLTVEGNGRLFLVTGS